MRKLIFILFVLISVLAKGQAIYNPSNSAYFQTTNKSYGVATAVSTDGRSKKLDSVNRLMRPYNGTAEVLTYLPSSIPAYRQGQFPIVVNIGGTLNSNGTFTGGQVYIYYFRNGVADSNLVLWNDVQSVNGQIGNVVIGSSDSIKKLPVDTSAAPRNGYLLTFDSTLHKWKLTAPASGYVQGTGIIISGNTISADNTTALWNANSLRGRSISTASPLVGQVYSWSGTAWTPSSGAGVDTMYVSNDTLYLVSITGDTLYALLNNINVINDTYNVGADSAGSFHFQVTNSGNINKNTTIDQDIDSIRLAANNIHFTEIISKADSLKLIYNNNGTLNKYIKLDTTSITTVDNINSFGQKYGADYSTNGKANPRWIPDIAAVRSTVHDSSGNYVRVIDSAAMLANYIRDKNYGLLKVGQTLKLDSAVVFPQVRATIPSTVTNLSYTQNATNNVVNSSTGTGATLLPATTSLAGLLDTARAKYVDSARGRLNTPSWNQTLAVNDTTANWEVWRNTSDVSGQNTYFYVPSNFGTSYPGFGVASKFFGGYQRFNGVNASGRPNVVASILGYNYDAGGNRLNTSEAGFDFRAESHYEINPSNQVFEFHMPEFQTLSGVTRRPWSFYIDKVSGNTNVDANMNQLSIYNPTGDTARLFLNGQDFRVKSFTDGTFSFRNARNQNGIDFGVNSGSNRIDIYGYGDGSGTPGSGYFNFNGTIVAETGITSVMNTAGANGFLNFSSITTGDLNPFSLLANTSGACKNVWKNTGNSGGTADKLNLLLTNGFGESAYELQDGTGYLWRIRNHGTSNADATHSLYFTINTGSDVDEFYIDPVNSKSVFNTRLGVATSTTTAYLQLGAGSSGATLAPLKFTAGTNLSTPESGAIEWDGTNLYVTQSSGPTRQTLAYIPTTNGTAGTDSVVLVHAGVLVKAAAANFATPYTFSTGLTNTGGAITNNLSTGVSGGQSVVGGTAANNNLTLSSTTNGTKGRIIASDTVVLNTLPNSTNGTDSLLVESSGIVKKAKAYPLLNLTASSAGTLSLNYTTDYIFTGTTTTWTLPAVSASFLGRAYQITIKNRGSGNITLNSNAGGNDIYSTSAVSTYTITPGSAIILLCDGTIFNVE